MRGLGFTDGGGRMSMHQRDGSPRTCQDSTADTEPTMSDEFLDNGPDREEQRCSFSRSASSSQFAELR